MIAVKPTAAPTIGELFGLSDDVADAISAAAVESRKRTRAEQGFPPDLPPLLA